ncbi:unnamed protein product, partial [Cyprideis torosa]
MVAACNSGVTMLSVMLMSPEYMKFRRSFITVGEEMASTLIRRISPSLKPPVFACVNLTNAEMLELTSFVAMNYIDSKTYLYLHYSGYGAPLTPASANDPNLLLIGIDTTTPEDIASQCPSDGDIADILTDRGKRPPALFFSTCDICIDRHANQFLNYNLFPHSEQRSYSNILYAKVISIYTHSIAKRWNSHGDNSTLFIRHLRPIIGDNNPLLETVHRVYSDHVSDITKPKNQGFMQIGRDLNLSSQSNISMADTPVDFLAPYLIRQRNIYDKLLEVPISQILQ